MDNPPEEFFRWKTTAKLTATVKHITSSLIAHAVHLSTSECDADQLNMQLSSAGSETNRSSISWTEMSVSTSSDWSFYLLKVVKLFQSRSVVNAQQARGFLESS